MLLLNFFYKIAKNNIYITEELKRIFKIFVSSSREVG